VLVFTKYKYNMNTRLGLNEIKRLLHKAQELTETLLEAQPKPTPGKPPEPRRSQRFERAIWNMWDELKPLLEFTVADVRKRAVKKAGAYPAFFAQRSDSSYSSILSRWAKTGDLEIVEQGKGRRPTKYKVPN
jgi:hypothetical protein